MKSIFSALLLLSCLTTFCQILIQNPGFEEFTTCPDDGNQVFYCNQWSAYKESPDYFNICAYGTHVAIPENWFGYQHPHSGDAYMGFATFNTSGFREFIGANLKNNLIIGQKYYVSLFVSLAFSNNGNMFIATNKLGLKCSTVPYNYWNPAPVNNAAPFYTDSVITDTANWVKLSGSFVADSAYNYIIIGNFFDNQHTDTISLNSNGVYSYYYIDDVCVTTDSLFNENWTGIRQSENENESGVVSVFPNPCTSQINVKINTKLKEPATISLLDATGKMVMQYQTTESEITFNTEKLAKGLYMVKVEKGEQVLLQKVIKE